MKPAENVSVLVEIAVAVNICPHCSHRFIVWAYEPPSKGKQCGCEYPAEITPQVNDGYGLYRPYCGKHSKMHKEKT